MGRLRRLELENFKSYAGKQIVGPFDDFTCIIGPNGAGKSNMMDAVSFVLGVQSRHLRSTHLKELIFRKDSSSAPARKASVKLVYETSEGEVPSMAGGTEIAFSRSIAASGVSTYKIDSKDVSYEAYESLLQSIGVLVKARNFLVFQGDVESVASKSPLDLTKLFEQVCGTDQLKEQYEALLQKKNDVEENTIFMMQKHKMFAAQRKEVKQQKDEAEEYQEQQLVLGNLKTEHVLWQIYRIRRGMEEHNVTCEDLRSKLQDVQNREQLIEETIATDKQEAARVSKVLSAAEKDYKAKKKSAEAVSPQIEALEARLKSLRKRLVDVEKSESLVRFDQTAQQNTIRELLAEIAGVDDEERALKRQLDHLDENSVRLDTRKVEEYASLRQLVAAETAAEKAEYDTLLLEIGGKKQQLQRIDLQADATNKECSIEQQLLDEYKLRSAKLQEGQELNEKELRETQLQREQYFEEFKANSIKLKLLEDELISVNEKLSEAGDERRRSKQEERMADSLETMQRIFTGVHGKLSDLCSPIQKKYATAVSVTAGRHMDAIVVDSKQVASECIRYLRDQRIGSCLFLPLDNISTTSVPERLRGLGSKYRLCVDLVLCEDKFKPAVAYALGSTIVCESLEDAQDLAFNRNERVKVVTLRGHVIGKSGAMTGGHLARDGAADRWEEKEVDKLRLRKIEVDAQIAHLRQNSGNRQVIAEFEMKFKLLQSRAQYCSADLNVVEEKTAQVQQQMAFKNKLIAEQIREKASLESTIANLEKRSLQLQNRLRDVESRIFKDFSASMGVRNIREFEENNLKQHDIIQKKRKQLSDRHAVLDAQLEYERKRDFDGALGRYQGQLEEVRKEIALLEKQVKTLVDKESSLVDAVKAASKELQVLSKTRSDHTEAAKRSLQKLTACVEEKEAIIKKISGEEILTERFRAQLHDLLQKAQVEEIALPVSDAASDDLFGDGLKWSGTQTSGYGREAREFDSESDSRSVSKSSKSSHSTHFSQSENDVVIRDQKKVARVDLSSVRNSKLSMSQISDKISVVSKKIDDLVLELQDKQPNMHAVEKYQGVLDKLQESKSELEEMHSAAREVSMAFDDVKKRRQQRFQDCFQHISEALGIIYQDLTKSSKHPYGGHAYLTLENTDEPYLGGIRFIAMPPMKRFRDMDQLSGGEKTVAALALLFSIHSFRQAPFFVLDEVDAALDNVNVKKICNYIKQRSKDFQCVVISLKDMFYEHADCLVGICKDVDSLSSKVLTLDLTRYEAPADLNPEPDTPVHGSKTSESISNSASVSLGKRKSEADGKDRNLSRR